MRLAILISTVAFALGVSAQFKRYCCSVNSSGDLVKRDGYTRSCCGSNSFDGSECTISGDTGPFENCCKGNAGIDYCV
ncbi:hypothetical protein F52700_631 [Fusarium sp. NRRL 52700]|nr:hypothetical protein F52700_631 [Fusarium sp. NRRL 52700]